MKKNNATNRGFTLIEIIVSLAVFIVVAVIAVGAFLKVLAANKQAQALETAMTNASFALDSMVRDMRVGYTYDCFDSSALSSDTLTTLQNSSCGIKTDDAVVAFYSSEEPSDWTCPTPPIHIYRFIPSLNGAPGMIEKAEQDDNVCSETISTIANNFIPLTSSSFDIQSLGVSVDTNTPVVQPKVFLYMTVMTGSNVQNQSVFALQTTISQRIMQ